MNCKEPEYLGLLWSKVSIREAEGGLHPMLAVCQSLKSGMRMGKLSNDILQVAPRLIRKDGNRNLQGKRQESA